MPAVPVGLVAERQLITRLMNADAMSAASAQRLDHLPFFQGRRLQRLTAKGVIREAQPGMYYLSAPDYAGHVNGRRRRAAFALAAVLALFALSMWVVEF